MAVQMSSDSTLPWPLQIDPTPPNPSLMLFLSFALQKAAWSAGSQRMATRKAFLKNPLKWYNEFWMPKFPHSYLRAPPNAAHRALASIAVSYEGVLCVTQNIDGLHCGSGQSGIPSPRLIEYHGRIGLYKCVSSQESENEQSHSCPYAYSKCLRTDDFSDSVKSCLKKGACNGKKGTLVSHPVCPGCENPTSPLALLFDEGYESHATFRFGEMQQWFEIVNAIVFIGTSHAVTATSLALAAARRRHIPVFEFNLVRNLTGMPLEGENGGGLDVNFIKGPAESTLPLLANMCGVGLDSPFSVEPLLPVPLPESSVKVDLDPELYCRLTHPNRKVEESIATEWELRKQENPKLFNGLKFRLHESELTEDGLILKCGITDYKTFMGCSFVSMARPLCCSVALFSLPIIPIYDSLEPLSVQTATLMTHLQGPYASKLSEDGRAHHGNLGTYLSCKLGVGCVLETSDGYVVLIQRSDSVAEGKGQMDGPGGHPEPDRASRGCGDGSNDDTNGVSPVHEVFGSILQVEELCIVLFFFIKPQPPLGLTKINPPSQEIEDEINIPQRLLSPPLLLGIVHTHNNQGTPVAVFSVRCVQTAVDVQNRYNHGPNEAFESKRIVLVETEQIRTANQARCYFSAMGILPTPALKGILSTWRSHKNNNTL